MRNSKYKRMIISWQEHQRTSSLAKRLGCELLIIQSRKAFWFRYPYCAFMTVYNLIRLRPSTVITTNPSLVLTLWMLILKPLFRFKLLVDAHNEGVEPYVNPSRWIIWLTRLFHKYADYTIVTNSALAEIVERNQGRSIILPDPLPDFSQNNDPQGNYLVCICTYAPDEPINDIIEKMIANNVQLKLTGKPPQSLVNQYSAHENIEFCGFLPESDYLDLLKKSAGVIDMTEMPNCLVCGAYEAVALLRPVIVADDPAYTETFLCQSVIPSTIETLGEKANSLLKSNMTLNCINEKAHFESQWNKHFEVFLEQL